ncbi:Protein P5 [Vibrio scophthalmi]|uniref:Protein P5 n=2 Tax=Vibrio scophthalmi TaxID=45658 RepID=A0A1E3WHD0_9VIBR|nr:Protein P5 [Vibrio scophthalmi]ODS12591.1 Protein P5 [Vibrio scophthalmi]
MNIKWAIALLILLLLSGVFMKTAIKPRGFRNNNPLNIDFNKANDWEGQVGIETGVTSPRFAKFVSMEYGVRAAAVLVRNYMRKYGLTTVHGIINRWAPSKENNTYSYVEHVAHKLGVSPYEPIQESDIPELLYHMIKHENGQYLDMATVIEGSKMAGISA